MLIKLLKSIKMIYKFLKHVWVRLTRRNTIGCLHGLFIKRFLKYGLQAERINLWASKVLVSVASVASVRCSSCHIWWKHPISCGLCSLHLSRYSSGSSLSGISLGRLKIDESSALVNRFPEKYNLWRIVMDLGNEFLFTCQWCFLEI